MDMSSLTSAYSVSNPIDGTNSSNISVDDYALATTSSKFQQGLIIWHQRMGHVNIDTIHTMSTNGSLTDFKLKKHVSLPNPCEGCMLGKQHKSTYTHDPHKQQSTIPGQFIHGDVSGQQAKTPLLKGSLYYILYKDDVIAYRFIHFAKQKFEAFLFFKRIVKIVKKDIGNDVLTLRIDQGKEFLNFAFT